MAHLLPATLPRLPGIAFCIFFMAFVYTQQSARAAESVTGKYLSATGTSVVLSLSMQKPSPANLIVEQYLAPGNKIAATSPRAKKIDAEGRTVKWLLTNTQGPTLTLTIQLKAPLQGKISAKVRYRDPGSGSYNELRIVP